MAYQLKKKLFVIIDKVQPIYELVVYAALANDADDFYNGIAERYNENDKTLDDFVLNVIDMINYGVTPDEYTPITGNIIKAQFNDYKNGGQFVVQELNVDTY